MGWCWCSGSVSGKKHAIWREQPGAPVTCEMDRRPSCECLDWQRWHPPRPFCARWHEPHALFFLWQCHGRARMGPSRVTDVARWKLLFFRQNLPFVEYDYDSDVRFSGKNWTQLSDPSVIPISLRM